MILGSTSTDRFRGGQGNDSLDGGAGTSDMVDYANLAASQAVSVNLASGRANDGQGGTDTLISIEQVRGTAGNDTIIGDGVDNIFRGNAGSDSLDGGAGTGDVADYAFATSAVSVNLTTGRANDGQGGTDTLANIERVWGSAFADTLIGGAGNDVLRGNAGNDSLEGGSGADHFIFNTALGTANVDRIQSYSATDDTILLDDAIFTALGSPGALAAGAFKAGAAATDADDRIIYNATTGALFYDQDGNGATAAVQFATLTSITGTITHADFLII